MSQAVIFDADELVMVPPYGFMGYGQADLKAVLLPYLERWGWPVQSRRYP